ETTLSGKTHLRRIAQWRDQGYFVLLHFLRLESVELAVERVRLRVQEGGHHIPEDVIQRRFKRGLKNLPLYQDAVDKWKLWDTSHGQPELIDEGE
ncbi:MAG: Zeta toxin family protein, partial [Candidatus Electrothrix sp. MAN1_4]|nr:Zeta toxin family protein [Candidatus Electrothrix sp. MAN1_4]